MARNNLPRPTRTDIHGIIPSIDENWFAQYAPMSEQEPQEQPGIDFPPRGYRGYRSGRRQRL